MTRKFLTIFTMLACASATSAHGQADTAFPGLIIDKTAVRTLEKAEALFESGNFKRAYFIYRHELAPIGDKFAQYMVGFMHLTGQGTDADRAAAAAWYRLAAERGTPEFVLVHDQLLVSLTPDQIAEYERLFLELRKQFGDLPILMQAVREDFGQLRLRTGTRLGSRVSPVTVIDVRRGGAVVSADQYYDDLETRLKARLRMIARYTQVDLADLDLGSIDLDAIEQQVNEELESLD